MNISGLALVLIILLLLGAFGGLPAWGYHNYGYVPSGGLVLLLIVVIALAISGRL